MLFKRRTTLLQKRLFQVSIWIEGSIKGHFSSFVTLLTFLNILELDFFFHTNIYIYLIFNINTHPTAYKIAYSIAKIINSQWNNKKWNFDTTGAHHIYNPRILDSVLLDRLKQFSWFTRYECQASRGWDFQQHLTDVCPASPQSFVAHAFVCKS